VSEFDQAIRGAAAGEADLLRRLVFEPPPPSSTPVMTDTWARLEAAAWHPDDQARAHRWFQFWSRLLDGEAAVFRGP
jgi:hypothetical protein